MSLTSEEGSPSYIQATEELDRAGGPSTTTAMLLIALFGITHCMVSSPMSTAIVTFDQALK